MNTSANQKEKSATQKSFDAFYAQKMAGNHMSQNTLLFWWMMGLVIILVLFYVFEIKNGWILFSLLALMIVGFVFENYHGNAKSWILQQVAQAFGLHYEQNPPRALPAGFQKAQEIGFIPKTIPSLKIQYGFWGETGGLLLDIYRVASRMPWWFWDHRADRWGMVFSLRLRRPTEGITILAPDGMAAKAKGAWSHLKRIKLEWLAFEEKFDLFSTDEKEARVLMAPDMMQAVYDLYQHLQEQSYKFNSLLLIFYQNEMCGFFYTEEDGMLRDKYNLSVLWKYLSVLSQFPALMAHKSLAFAWQDKERLEKRSKTFQEEDIPTPGFALGSSARDRNMNAPDRFGITPLMQSILQGNTEAFIAQLNSPYADINQTFKTNGNTLLHLAVLNGRIEMVQALLEYPALDRQAKNGAGETALDLAKRLNNPEIMALLQK